MSQPAGQPGAEAKGSEAVPKKPPVPETLKKKRISYLELKARRIARKPLIKKKSRTIRKLEFKKGQKYAKEYRQRERRLVIQRRAARSGGNFFREPEPKLALVVRIRGINGVDPRTRKILRLFRLRQIQNAVFVRLNGATIKMLRLVEPYITWGTPNLKTVRELIYKRGFAKLSGQRRPITDNKIIAKKLKKYGIICIEDVIHEIFTVGRHFKYVNKFLWPFKLSSPRGGYKKKSIHFQEGGDAGCREHRINNLVQRMN